MINEQQQDQQLELDLGTVVQGSSATVLSLDDTDIEQEETTEVDEELSLSPDEDLSSLLDDEEAVVEEEDEETDVKFDRTFEKKFGMSVNEAKELVESLAQERAERGVRQQQEALASHWSVPQQEVERRLIEVRNYWDKLPDEKKAKLDNVEGAKAIWAKLSNTKAPKLDRTKGTPSGVSQRYLYTEKQIAKMPQAEYESQADAIASAYARGLVKR